MDFNLLLLLKFKTIGRILRKSFAFLLLLASFVLIVLSKTDNKITDKVSSAGLDIIGPVMYVLEFPARAFNQAYTHIYDMSRIYADNRALKEENKHLLYLQNQVHVLKAENELLSQLLHYSPPPEATYVSAKIIAQSGDEFTHSVIIYIGDSEVKKGQVVLAAESVVGRIDQVGDKYAKVILINDIGSKIPVVIEKTRTRGILSGNNTRYPKLIFVKPSAEVQEGDLVVTSGVGGIFPGGLPIGFVNAIHGTDIEIEPISDLDRIEYVSIVDYNLSPENGVNDLTDKKKNE